MSISLIQCIDGAELEEPNDERAFLLVIEGRARLHRFQAEPPSVFLDRIERIIEGFDTSVIGESIDAPDTLERMDNELFREGVRRRALNGMPLPWHTSRDELSAAIISCALPHADPPVWLQVKNVLESARAKAPRTRRRHSFPRPKLDAKWLNFQGHVSRLSKALMSLAEEAQEERRLVIVETGGARDRYWSPPPGKCLSHFLRLKKIEVALSSDVITALPPSRTHAGLAAKRAEAARQMYVNYMHFKEQGLKPTAKDLRAWARQEFGLSEKAAEDAWEIVAQRTGKLPGNPKEHEKVPVSDFKRLDI